jgi:transcriptional regulator with XRE-family HTH domain
LKIEALLSRIETELQALGISRDELAMRAGLSRQTVWRILTRQTERPRKATVRRLTRALGIPDADMREVLTGQYEMLPITERLIEDDALFQKALTAQLEAVPERLRLEAVRAAIVTMAGVMQQSRSPTDQDPYRVLRSMERARWQARNRRQTPSSQSDSAA